jgi:hypothetical protein
MPDLRDRAIATAKADLPGKSDNNPTDDNAQDMITTANA